MSSPSDPIVLLFCAVALILVSIGGIIAVLRSSRAAPAHKPIAEAELHVPALSQAHRYGRKQYLLTAAERAFFTVLKDAVPTGWYIFPQVRLESLVLIEGRADWQARRNRVAQKSVDFVLCDPGLSSRLVIELDDSSHSRPDRQARDRFVDSALASAELPILHIRCQRSYDAEAVAQLIDAQLGRSDQGGIGLVGAATGTPRRPTQSGGSRDLANPWTRPLLPITSSSTPGSTSGPNLPAPPLVMPPASGTPTPGRACPTCFEPASQLAKCCKNCGTMLPLI